MPADLQTTNPATSEESERAGQDESRLLQQQWHGWGSPIGLGIGLLSVGGFFVLLALGLSILSTIG